MAIEIGLAIVLGVVVQDAYTVEVLAPLGNGRVVHAEQDRLLPQCLWHYGKRPQRQGLANGCICDKPVAEGTVIAVERCDRLFRQELLEQATHRRSRLQSQLSDEGPRQQMARRPRRRWEQGRKSSGVYQLQISRCIMKSSHSLSLRCWCGLAISLYTIRRLCDFIVLQKAVNCCSK